MKQIALFALGVLLLTVTTAQAARPNLIVNGSFEDGFNGWEMHDTYSLAPGLCGPNAANLEQAFARQVGYKLQAGRTYKLTFRYVGTVQTSVMGEQLHADEWQRFSRKFTAERTGDTVWFMGFEGLPLLVDCVKLVRL
jgi:hypothetical protein